MREVLVDYAAHYKAERNHQALGNELIERRSEAASGNGAIRCRKRGGGVLKYYYRQAA